LKPSKEYLDKIFKDSGIILSSHQLDAFWTFHSLLRERNQELDLTRIHNFENMVIKHYVDCSLVTKYVNLPLDLMDLGTGAGFPGIPIKILRPEIKLHLVETREDRIRFLQEAVSLLGLKGVEVLKKKLTGPLGRTFDGVITRALEDIPATLKRVRDVLKPGGLVIFMKGPHCDEEIKKAGQVFQGIFTEIKNISYVIPNTIHERRIIVYERLGANILKQKAIKSEDNEAFKFLRSLLTSKGIEKHRHCLMWGQKFINEILKKHKSYVKAIITKIGGPYLNLGGHSYTYYELSPPLFEELDIFNTAHPMLLIKTPPFLPLEDLKGKKGLKLLIPFQDPNNVGAAIRTAVAMGVEDILLLGSAAHPFHPRSTRSCGPYLLDASLYQKATPQEISHLGEPIIALAPPPKGQDILSFHFPESFILAPGLEGPGLPEGLSPQSFVSIPMEGGVESLNAAMATGIALFWARKGSKALRS